LKTASSTDFKDDICRFGFYYLGHIRLPEIITQSRSVSDTPKSQKEESNDVISRSFGQYVYIRTRTK